MHSEMKTENVPGAGWRVRVRDFVVHNGQSPPPLDPTFIFFRRNLKLDSMKTMICN